MREKKPLFLHGRPHTRRDFLATGLLSFAATIGAPAWGAMRWVRDDAETFPETRFLAFDLVGGASLPGNFLVGGEGGPEDLLPSYDLLGWQPTATDALDKNFGLPMAKKASRFLAGLRETASAEALAHLRFASFCHFGQDDTATNPLSAFPAVARAGARGRVMTEGLGTLATLTGGNSTSPVLDTRLAPVPVTTVDDVSAAVSYGPAFADLSGDARRVFAEGVARLTGAQRERFASFAGGPLALERWLGAAARMKSYAGGVPGLDPRQEAIAQRIFGLKPNTAPNAPAAVQAAVIWNVLGGRSGPGAIALGGYDYHDGTQTTGDQKDLEAGQTVGRAVECAHALGVRLCLQILTDGGVTARRGTREWAGDAGDKSMTVLGVYDPAGPRTLRRLQVGHYTRGQSAALTTNLGSSPAKVAYAVLLNWLVLEGRLGEWEQWIPPGTFRPGEIDGLLLFA